jgi:hypothetical protein
MLLLPLTVPLFIDLLDLVEVVGGVARFAVIGTEWAPIGSCALSLRFALKLFMRLISKDRDSLVLGVFGEALPFEGGRCITGLLLVPDEQPPASALAHLSVTAKSLVVDSSSSCMASISLIRRSVTPSVKAEMMLA